MRFEAKPCQNRTDEFECLPFSVVVELHAVLPSLSIAERDEVHRVVASAGVPICLHPVGGVQELSKRQGVRKRRR